MVTLQFFVKNFVTGDVEQPVFEEPSLKRRCTSAGPVQGPVATKSGKLEI